VRSVGEMCMTSDNLNGEKTWLDINDKTSKERKTRCEESDWCFCFRLISVCGMTCQY
jgi:hypothetical protein